MSRLAAVLFNSVQAKIDHSYRPAEGRGGDIIIGVGKTRDRRLSARQQQAIGRKSNAPICTA